MVFSQGTLWALLTIPIVTAILAIAAAYWLYKQVLELDRGNEKMVKVSDAIMDGSWAFIKRQYTTIAIIGGILAFVIYFALDFFTNTESNFPYSAIAFVLGAAASLLAGAVSMLMAAQTNSRTTQAAKTGRSEALETAFKGGLVMGLLVVAFSIFGIAILFGLYSIGETNPSPSSIIAFGFGASFAALFAQLGGGIFTKAADVGADLVGKLEAGIPEDDPRNPGVIADNVGDAVGDCAGRGADLFESISGETIGGMIVGLLFYNVFTNVPGMETMALAFILFPLIARGLTLLLTWISYYTVTLKEGEENAMKPLSMSFYYISAGSFLVFAILIWIFFGFIWQLILSAAIGIALAVFTLLATDYYTGANKPVMDIVKSSETGAATNIITGLSVGMASTWVPMLSIVFAIISTYALGSSFGNSDNDLARDMQNAQLVGDLPIPAPALWGIFSTTMATMAMLSMTPMILAMDGYGPIADQSGGIAQMSDAGEDVRSIIDSLDMVGNTTKALAKGYGMTSAGLAALLLFQAYLQDYEHETGVYPVINLVNPAVLSALFIGALLPFIFSSMTMGAVGRAANEMIQEIRSQFKKNGPAIMNYEMEPDYAACIDVSTRAALKEMIVPSLLVVATPILVGLAFGAIPLAAFLIGATASGILLGLTLNNAGGAFDNAKKVIEARSEDGKGTVTHEAAVIGDTVGDPMKDTAGPSIHVLIKLVNTIAITMIIVFANADPWITL